MIKQGRFSKYFHINLFNVINNMQDKTKQTKKNNMQDIQYPQYTCCCIVGKSLCIFNKVKKANFNKLWQ